MPFSTGFGTLPQRIRKDVGANWTEYLYFGGAVLSEITPNGTTDYIYNNGQIYARASGPDPASTFYYHQDHLGTSKLITDSTGTVVSNCTFAPFGQQVNCSPDDSGNHYRFTGDEYDSESNTHHTQFRQLAGTQGRWLSPDPYLGSIDLGHPQSINRYTYVLNTPTNLLDPSGMLGVKQNVPAVTDWTSTGWTSLTLIPTLQDSYVPPGIVSSAITSDFIPGTDLSVSFVPGGFTTSVGSALAGSFIPMGGGTGGGRASGGAANNGSWWSGLTHSPWVLSWILPLTPVPGIAGVGPAGSIAWNPATKTLCGSIGAGASVGDNLAVGPVTGRTLDGQQASPSQINQIFGGWSISGGINVPIGPVPVGPGVQGSANGSGAVYGPTVGIAGASVASTYAVCASF